MHNWSNTDYSALLDQDQREIKELEQLINFGLNGEKISRARLKKHLPVLNIDPFRKQFLELLLCN